MTTREILWNITKFNQQKQTIFQNFVQKYVWLIFVQQYKLSERPNFDFFSPLGLRAREPKGKKNLNLFLAGHLGSKNKHVPVSYTQVIKAKIKTITYLAHAVDMIRYDWLSSRASIKGKHDLKMQTKHPKK